AQAAGSAGLDEDRARAAQAAARRRRRRQLQVVAIRLVSLASVLTLWQVFGADISPILFTTPLAVAKAAATMIASGELWTYLAPSLLVLAMGLALAAVAGVAIGLLFARFWRSEEHTSELQSRGHLVCRLRLEKKKG